MPSLNPSDVQPWFEWLLLWIGFGTCVGLLAKALMPGRDPGGAVATLLMGITGVAIGCGCYSLVYGERISPITTAGLACGTMGALVILVFYRLLGGFVLDEAGSRQTDDPKRRRQPRDLDLEEHAEIPRRRRRKRYSYYLDD